MRMVIVGGGKVGVHLARILIEKKHEVSLVERDRQRCLKLAEMLDAEIYKGDGTDVNALEAAGAAECDCFMPVTGSDQDNLVASHLANDHFHAKKVIARANDPRNIETFKLLGVNRVVSSTDIITKIIEQEADVEHLHLVASLNKGKAGIVSITLDRDTAYDNVQIKDIVKFPSGSLIISVIKDGKLVIPNGYTHLSAGDEIVAVCDENSQKQYTKIMTEKKRY